MSPPHRPTLAALLLLTVAVLNGGCSAGDSGEGVLFACESDGSCSQEGHVCDSDRLCRPDRRREEKPGGPSMQTHEAATSPRSGQGGPGKRASLMPAPAPSDESEEDRCARRCAERQGDCTESCGDGTRCRQHCDRSTEACYARCQQLAEVKKAALQRLDDHLCMGADGRPRKCNAAEALELRKAMLQAAGMLCKDRSGALSLCPEHHEQLEKSKRLASKYCRGPGCKGDAQE